MFGIKTRKLNERIDRLRTRVEAAFDSRSALRVNHDSLVARVRALEEATKPKSGRVKSDG